MTDVAAPLPAVRIAIPWRPQPSRLEAFDRVVEWYRRNLPGVPLVTVDTDEETFVLAACRNAAMSEAAFDEVVVIGDADTIPERDPLLAAIRTAAVSDRVQLPYDEYRWLGRTGTADYVTGVPPEDCRVEQVVHTACSGVYVATPRVWASHGGQDEGFRGWGFEDAAWFEAHSTLLGGPPQRHPGRVYALHHAAAPREGERFQANVDRMGRYRAAAGDTRAMRLLVAQPVDELDRAS
ncbi:hypothetical protein [Microbacterium sp. BK668]|uniref:hypothetical protein n=1 Tax=Microbacterium sp. BK668 TaxID=2512118 RepID=UPI00105D765C|nr:hypothetical protein [Microbacterium sp. BK668]TDN91779.1 hypothetical protein EV279_1284 [Microbacterium sp. BK668]